MTVFTMKLRGANPLRLPTLPHPERVVPKYLEVHRIFGESISRCLKTYQSGTRRKAEDRVLPNGRNTSSRQFAGLILKVT